MTAAHAAILRSITHDEIVTIDYDTDGAAHLEAECEDSVDVTDQHGVTEYWGTDEDGAEWRVHMRAEVVPVIAVLGLGEAFDLPDECDSDPDMEWYGTVNVQIGERLYAVGACLGVEESERDSCRASGGNVRPYLMAWYADASDWDAVDVPQARADEVINAIAAAADRLWSARCSTSR